MNLISSSGISQSYLTKTQVNNFINYTPPKSQSMMVDNMRDFTVKNPSQYSASPTKYSPELEGFRREVNDQIRSLVYSFTNDIKTLKKENSDYRFEIEEMRREIESTNSKFLQHRSAQNTELQNLREIMLSTPEQKNATRLDETLRNSWLKADKKDEDYGLDIRSINERISQISRQIHTINADLEANKAHNYVSRDSFNKSMGDIIDELERKLNIINERVRERIEEMDGSLVQTLKDKDQDFQKLYYDIRNIQSTMIRVTDQVNTFTHSSEISLDDSIKKVIQNYASDLRNLNTILNTAEQKVKTLRKDEPLGLSSTLNLSQHQNKEIEAKIKELDSIYQTVGLLEKELRSKADMVDLNINSIKRSMELELSIQIKQMIVPIQKNLEQYLQATEGRFCALEDAVLNHMKRDSYLITAERTNRLRGSQTMEEMNQYLHKAGGFENYSSIEPHQEERHEKAAAHQPDFKPSHSSFPSNTSGQKTKERFRQSQDTFKMDEVESVVSVLQTTMRNNDDKQRRSEDKFFDSRAVPEISELAESKEVAYFEQQDAVFEKEAEEEEEIFENVAKTVLPDKDKNKKQRNTQEFFSTFEEAYQPETMFKDYPSSGAFKNMIESLNPNKKSPGRKKSGPEMDSTPKDTNKKSSAAKSPLTLDSKMILTTEVYEDEEQVPEYRPNKNNSNNRKKMDEVPADLTDRIEEPDEVGEQEFSGNIKGLLRKSRINKKELNSSIEDLDTPMGRSKSPPKVRNDEQPKAALKNNQKPLSQNKPLDKPVLGKNAGGAAGAGKNQKGAELPPVDTKSVKNFNKGPKDLPPAKGGYGQKNQNNFYGNNSYVGNNSNGWNQNNAIMEEEEEGVEEIVYHVDEEGFLVDENGNYLVDEQGNFLQLSADQMKEIEDKDLVFENNF